MPADPKPSWITWLLEWALSWFRRRDAQVAADTAQQHHLEAETNAIHAAQADAPADVHSFADSVRRGDSL